MKKNKGFTLIELLVVIAIIGVLASVVLASLNTARNKGADAAVKENLANARAQAELFYDSNTNAYVITADGTTDVCSPTASAGSSAVKGINQNVLAATQASQGAAGTVNITDTTIETASGAGSGVCYSAAGSWVAQAPLKTSGYWCVDYLGTSEPQPSLLPASSIKCP